MELFAGRIYMNAEKTGPSPAKKKSVEDIDRNNDTTSQNDKNPNSNSETEIPPNENIRKFPDETYGDTEIPGREKDL
jgi:hypothetical protein